MEYDVFRCEMCGSVKFFQRHEFRDPMQCVCSYLGKCVLIGCVTLVRHTGFKPKGE